MARHPVAGAWLAGLALAVGLGMLAVGLRVDAVHAQAPAGGVGAASVKADALGVLLNRARVGEGLKPLARNADLDRAAEQHSRDMASHNYLDHTAPDGSEPMDRAIRAGYGARKGTGWIVVEVISAISGEPEGPLNWWLKESPEVHGRVLRNPRWREMGVGYAAGGEYGNYWTVLVGCQPRVLPAVVLDGRTFQHAEECDQSEPPPPTRALRAIVPGQDPAGASEIEVSWAGLTQPRATDWIGLFRAGAADNAYVAWRYLGCTTASPAAEGRCSLPVPAGLPTDEYELRLYQAGGFAEVARSDRFRLQPRPAPSPTASPAPAPTASPVLSTEPDVVRPGERLRVTWSDLRSPSPRDWLGLYAADRPGRPSTAWTYVSCSTAPVEARTGGSCDLEVPPGTEPGRYEVRFFPDDATASTASSGLQVAPTTPASGAGG
jgi:hypothetical protein